MKLSNCLVLLVLFVFAVPVSARQTTRRPQPDETAAVASVEVAKLQDKSVAPEADQTASMAKTVSYRLQNLDAEKGQALLQELLQHDGKHRDVQSQVAQDAILPELTFTAYKPTNSIVFNGRMGDVEAIGQILTQVDKVTVGGNAEPKVYRLSNSPAIDVAKAMNDWFDARQQMLYGEKNVAQQRSMRIVPEVVSNSLIVSSNMGKSQMHLIEGMIRSLDTRPQAIRVNVVVKQAANGHSTIVSKPSVLAFNGQTVSVQIGDKVNGTTIEITPAIIEAVEAVKHYKK